ncbi:hypothetical protein AYO38_01285 [bacterium SCGC AG-212-C10]|nr:hypothetical protein AYO38_01285 [bacterium SCGC AG-212-C10]
MAYSVADVEGFLRVLRENPEWRDAVPREVLGEELLSLPDLVRQNSEDIRALKEVVRQNSEDIRELHALVRQNSEDIRDLVRVTQRHETWLTKIDGRLESAEGRLSETRWRERFSGRFGGLVRRARLVSPRDLELFEDADDHERITEAEADAVRRLDILIEGTRKRGTREEVLLAVEVSNTIDRKDMSRVSARAATLRKVGYNAIPVLAGARMDASLKAEAERAGIEVVLTPGDILEFDPLTGAPIQLPADDDE